MTVTYTDFMVHVWYKQGVLAGMQGAAEVVQGVFMGGFEEARFGIRTGAKQSSQFRYVRPLQTCFIPMDHAS